LTDAPKVMLPPLKLVKFAAALSTTGWPNVCGPVVWIMPPASTVEPPPEVTLKPVKGMVPPTGPLNDVTPPPFVTSRG
jgi:hypothetical protein